MAEWGKVRGFKQKLNSFAVLSEIGNDVAMEIMFAERICESGDE